MENFAFSHGFTSSSNGPGERAPLWRPWTGTGTGTHGAVTHPAQTVRRDVIETNYIKPGLQVVHPVKLFWPKSKCFDYLYHDAEQLLRNYPVQATICPCDQEESEDEEESQDEDEEEDTAKDMELN